MAASSVGGNSDRAMIAHEEALRLLLDTATAGRIGDEFVSRLRRDNAVPILPAAPNRAAKDVLSVVNIRRDSAGERKPEWIDDCVMGLTALDPSRLVQVLHWMGDSNVFTLFVAGAPDTPIGALIVPRRNAAKPPWW